MARGVIGCQNYQVKRVGRYLLGTGFVGGFVGGMRALGIDGGVGLVGLIGLIRGGTGFVVGMMSGGTGGGMLEEG